PTLITSSPEDLEKADALILPGVGAFGSAMKNIRELHLEKAILSAIEQGKPLLGICLGLQILMEESEESPGIKGLGVVKGKVVRIKGDVRIPHMGWNILKIKKESPLFEGIEDGEMFYFVHSYYVEPEEDVVIGETEYPQFIPCAIQKGNIFGVQFHPEKSSSSGMKVLKNFGRIVQCSSSQR
ncbi:MAG: imidazole glycerol phosphate synthase subunit HisH, partial [bacterium]